MIVNKNYWSGHVSNFADSVGLTQKLWRMHVGGFNAVTPYETSNLSISCSGVVSGHAIRPRHDKCCAPGANA